MLRLITIFSLFVLSSAVFFDQLFNLPDNAGSAKNGSVSLTGAELEQLYFRTCYSCHGTTISTVTSSCWQTVDEDYTRFVKTTSCIGTCSTTVLNHTSIGLVEYTRRCEPECRESCYKTDKQTELCKYCCLGDRCNDILPTFIPETHDTVGHGSERNIRNWFSGVFSKPRHHAADPSNKVATRKLILKLYNDFGLAAEMQHFNVWQVDQEDKAPAFFTSFIKTVVRGYNVIATIRGSKYGTMRDQVIVIMAHYDTHSGGTAGVDANGSGVVALLEIARLLERRDDCSRSNTVILVATDFNEEGHFADGLSNSGYTSCYVGEQFNGLAGAAHFVCGWLMPHLRRTGSRLQLAINLDSLLNYDNRPSTQSLPNYYQIVTSHLSSRGNRALRKFEKKVSRRKFAGDWIMASYVDLQSGASRVSNHVARLKRFWSDATTNLNAALIGKGLSAEDGEAAGHDDCLVFQRLRVPLPCISITDTGPLRGYMRRCHNANCDDTTHVTDNNVKFIIQTINSVWRLVEELSESSCQSDAVPITTTTTTPVLTTTEGLPQSGTVCDRPLLKDSLSGVLNTSVQITAACRYVLTSLELCRQTHGPDWGHLNSGSAWVPKKAKKSSSRQLWFKADLGGEYNVTAIALQGVKKIGYVRAFMVSYSRNDEEWNWHIPERDERRPGLRRTELKGNSNWNSPAKSELYPPLVARYVRVHPRQWRRRIALRAEIFGCAI